MILEGINNILIGYEGTIAHLRAIQERRHPDNGIEFDEKRDVNEQLEPPNLDLADPQRRIWIFTTACMPWMTGTSVNPLLRAAFLSRGREKGHVTLVVPWLESDDQIKIFPSTRHFSNQNEQAEYIRSWLAEVNLEDESNNVALRFYKSTYHEAFGSIFPLCDLTSLVPNSEADVCILEEPEHLNWFKPEGEIWTSKFNYVIGIIHTNYMFYAGQEMGGTIKKEVVRMVSAWMVRAHCHRVIKLSGALQTYAPEKEVVCNVHGVRDQFLEIGSKIAGTSHETALNFSKGIYFIGKTLWSKGFDKLLPLLRSYRRRHAGSNLEIEAFGDGPDKEAIEKRCARYKLGIKFLKGIDHKLLTHHKIFLNPSQSEVLCTTIAEALAMGKFVICARHASNQFFYQFPNCLHFGTSKEFIECVKIALVKEPLPLTDDLKHVLSWPAANERLVKISSLPLNESTDSSESLAQSTLFFGTELPQKQRQSLQKLDEFLADLHIRAMKGRHGRVFRTICGAPDSKNSSGINEEFVIVHKSDIERESNEHGKAEKKIRLSKSELSLVELLSAGIHQGMVESVLNPLVAGYRHFMEQGLSGLLGASKKKETEDQHGQKVILVDNDLYSKWQSIDDNISSSVSSSSAEDNDSIGRVSIKSDTESENDENLKQTEVFENAVGLEELCKNSSFYSCEEATN